MRKPQFLTPVITVFQKDSNNIDIPGCRRVYDRLVENGVSGLVFMGSTGEFFSMNMDMQKQVIDLATEYAARGVRVLVGVSRMTPQETIELANYAYSRGIREVMIVSPYYFKLTDRNLEAYYDEVASATLANIFIYNFPERTVHDMSPELTLRLVRKHKNIVGYKDTTTNMSHTSALLRTILPEFPDFQVYNGYEDNFIHTMLSGGAGCIGGLSNLMPRQCADLVKAVEDRDFEKMIKLQEYIDDAMAIYAIADPFIPTAKRGLQLQGLGISDTCVEPFRTLDDEQEKTLRTIMERLHIL